MKLYNTLSRSKEELPSPDKQKHISLYSCGPTVYDETHIGHMRKYIMDDILVRTLKYVGYDVKHVMNITDVGHLTGDDDCGDDKLEKGAQKENKTVEEVARHYTDKFFETMDALGVERPDEVLKATDNIQPMIDLIKQLEKKGYTYETAQAIYFDITKFRNYGQLSGQKLEEKKQAVREDVFVDTDKKHPADFALWFRRVGRFANHTLHWPSPWGDGFPGWHIECSAMSMKALGETIDIHTGGIDHIPVHHENEIAQSEAATGKQFVKYWVHHAFLKVDGEKMSKSKENFYTLADIHERGIDPMALRYLFLQTHYRKELNFTWEAVEAAQNALHKLQRRIPELKMTDTTPAENQYVSKFKKALADDLNTSEAIATLWGILESDLPNEEKYTSLKSFDSVLKLGLSDIRKNKIKIPEDITNLANQRIEAKKQKDFQRADELRKEIEAKGYIIEDTVEGYIIKKSDS